MKPINRFEKRLADPRPILLDGGLATQIEAGGASLHPTLWSAGLLHTAPEIVANAHRDFADAGAEIIATATYQASVAGFMGIGLSQAEAESLLTGSVRLAREATAHHPETLIAASLGPWGAVQTDGSEYTGAYDVAVAELERFHRERLALMDRSGADVLALETIPNLQEARVLAECLRDVETPAWVSFCCRDDSSLSDGTPIETVVALFDGHPRVLALGVNCTAPGNIPRLLRRATAASSLPMLVYPNSGEQYDVLDRCWIGEVAAGLAGDAALDWISHGARGIGGCCRMGSEHIRSMAQAIDDNNEF